MFVATDGQLIFVVRIYKLDELIIETIYYISQNLLVSKLHPNERNFPELSNTEDMFHSSSIISEN